MIRLAMLVGYVASWYVAAVGLARTLSSRMSYCHGEGSYKWGHSGHHCRKYDPDGCWRADPAPSVRVLLYACGLALVWPIALLLVGVYLSAAKTNRHVDPRYIARLERELGIGDPR